MNIIEKINAESSSKKVPDFRPGDTVRVHQVIQEGGKQRIQIFEGLVTARRGGGVNESFIVRKIAHNIGVERIYPLFYPLINKIEVKQRGHVRRAKLYYLKTLRGKAAKIEESKQRYSNVEETSEATAPVKETSKEAKNTEN